MRWLFPIACSLVLLTAAALAEPVNLLENGSLELGLGAQPFWPGCDQDLLPGGKRWVPPLPVIDD